MDASLPFEDPPILSKNEFIADSVLDFCSFFEKGSLMSLKVPENASDKDLSGESPEFVLGVFEVVV